MTTPACSPTGRDGSLPRDRLQRLASPGPWPLESRTLSTSFLPTPTNPGMSLSPTIPGPWQAISTTSVLISPIFYKDQLAAFTACVFHHSDIGGRVSSDNHDVFEEGLFIPLVKLYDGGVLNPSVIEMIRWNVRTADEVIGDIRSQIAANHVCTEKDLPDAERE